MKLTELQNLTIQARMAGIVGAEIYDRLFSGVCFDELDGDLLCIEALDQASADGIEDEFSIHIAVISTAILKSHVEDVLVHPKLQ